MVKFKNNVMEYEIHHVMVMSKNYVIVNEGLYVIVFGDLKNIENCYVM